MIDNLKNATAAKLTSDTITASAASIGILTFLGITLTSWVQILTCIWFVILIGKWLVQDVYPFIKRLRR